MLKPVKRGGDGRTLARRPAPQKKAPRMPSRRFLVRHRTALPGGFTSPIQQHFPAPDPYRAF
ncbi:hypothetical protein BamMC406_5432 [Burkholderia ambifaria MC40-6]|uniref:Uncharacterized protein n=1 Tax=Burkholderia ambifaria (strain MC40-6) TaxID=398577 RepID=B1Z2B4_BURA4|nr:hypothetical protein BamMC406_5432 [Burkholderia ambifaria MC40-6]